MPDNQPPEEATRQLVDVPFPEARKLKFPEQIVMVTSLAPSGRANIITLGWVMQASTSPPMVAIGVRQTSYSHDLILESGEFVVCYPTTEMTDEMLYCGTHSGRDVDKFAETGLVAMPAKVVRPPLIGGSVACLECRVVGSLVTGDHRVFVGEVVASHASRSPLRRLFNFGDGVYAGAEQTAH